MNFIVSNLYHNKTIMYNIQYLLHILYILYLSHTYKLWNKTHMDSLNNNNKVHITYIPVYETKDY